MKQNRTILFALSIGLFAIATIASSCRKYAYNENDNYTHCYCVYYVAPGVERREDVRMRSTSRKFADYNCSITIQDEKAKIYGYKNVSCSID